MIHGSLVDSRTGYLELRLELYHRCELQLGYQQSITEILLWRTQTSGLPTNRQSGGDDGKRYTALPTGAPEGPLVGLTARRHQSTFIEFVSR